MRILLTGASGQVGTETQRRLRARALLAPDRRELDLCKTATISTWLQQHSPELILNVGAYTAVDRAEEEPEAAFHANHDAVQALADYANQHDVPLIHLSTDYVFDGTLQRPYSESDKPRPVNVYGASKLAGEDAARSAKRHVILRTSWVFSAQSSNFVRTMLRLGATHEVLSVVDDQRGGPTWAGDIADALDVLAGRLARGETLPAGTWHYAGEPHVSWYNFAGEIFERAYRRGLIARVPRVEPISTQEYPTRALRPSNSRLDCSRAARELGLRIPDWRAGLDATLEQLRRNAGSGV